MHKIHPFPTEELLERIPLAGSVISGLRHFVRTNHLTVTKEKRNRTF